MALFPLPKGFSLDFYSPNKKPIGSVVPDLSNGMARDLTGAFLFQPGSVHKNSVPNMPDIVPATGPNLGSIAGDADVDDSVNYGLEIGNKVIGGATTLDTDWTFFAIINLRKPSVGNNDQFIIAAQNNNEGGDQAIYFDNTGTNARVASFNSGTKITINSQEPAIGGRDFQSFSFTNESTSNTRKIFIEGGTLAGGAQNSDNNSFGVSLVNDSLHLFTDNGQTARRIDAICKVVYIFNRTLSDEEIAQLHRNPYSILKPKAPQVYFTPAAAPGGLTVNVPVGTITLTGQTPTIDATANITVSVPVGAISLTGQAPSVLTGDDVEVSIPLGAISLTGLTPVIQATNNISVDIPIGSISLTGFAPTIQTGDFVTVAVPVGAISLTGLAPAIDLTNNISVSIPTGSISLAGFAPIVDLGDLTVNVNSGTITLSGFAPIVIVGGAVWTVQPDSVTNWSDQTDSVTTWTIQ